VKVIVDTVAVVVEACGVIVVARVAVTMPVVEMASGGAGRQSEGAQVKLGAGGPMSISQATFGGWQRYPGEQPHR